MTGNLMIGCMINFYKRGFDNTIGQKLRKQYEDGTIKSRKEYEEVLKLAFLLMNHVRIFGE